MELPITRPSQMSYGDEIEFNELLEKLNSKKFNGFIRVTSQGSEGFILLNNGMQSASSFDNYSKKEALEQIESTVDNSKTLIEVFDLKESQMKYLMDLNKFFIIDSESKIENIIDDLKNNKTEETKSTDNLSIAEEKVKVIPEKTESDIGKESEILETESKNEIISEQKKDNIDPITEEIKESQAPIRETGDIKSKKEITSNKKENKNNYYYNNEIDESPKTIIKRENKKNSLGENFEPEISITSRENEVIKTPQDVIITENNPKYEDKEAESLDEYNFIESGIESEDINREDLMKKYGLKDVEEKEVDDLIETYKGGSLSDDDIEKIELTLMNKIKKLILGIPKIKGTEVMVFLDNSSELSGIINIITEYESKGLLYRIMGESRDIDKIKKQITDITQMEIKKSFRRYPEIIDDIKINVEIS
jgi:hypothetical protein